MKRSPLVWLGALWIGTLIHVDWHLGRPGHDHLSLALPYHWVLAVPAFAPLPWLLVRRRPISIGVSAQLIALGVVVGQGLEPLGELILYPAGPNPFTNLVRWRILAEFMAAGLATYLANVALAVRQTRAAA